MSTKGKYRKTMSIVNSFGLIYSCNLATLTWTILSTKKPNFQTKLEPVCRGISYSFLANITVQTLLSLFRARQFA